MPPPFKTAWSATRCSLQPDRAIICHRALLVHMLILVWHIFDTVLVPGLLIHFALFCWCAESRREVAHAHIQSQNMARRSPKNQRHGENRFWPAARWLAATRTAERLNCCARLREIWLGDVNRVVFELKKPRANRIETLEWLEDIEKAFLKNHKWQNFEIWLELNNRKTSFVTVTFCFFWYANSNSTSSNSVPGNNLVQTAIEN